MNVNLTTWDNFIQSNGPLSGSFLQSYEWGEFQESLGRKVIRILENDFAAQIIKVPLAFGLYYLYIPKGPIFKKNSNSKIQIPNLISFLVDTLKKEGAVFMRIEPEILDEEDIVNLKLLKSPARQAQPNRTLILNLEQPFEDVLSGMHPKTRYNIHLAERHGIEVRIGNEFGEFLRLLKETAERDKFYLHPIEYYKKMADFFFHRNNGGLRIKLWTAKYSNQMIASVLIGYFGNTATYLHGASSKNFRHLMAPHLLHWEIIKNAKAEGYKYYDFWGIDEKKWPGLTRFKKGFASEASPDPSVGSGFILTYPGAFDLPINKNWYKIYQLAKKLNLKPS